MLGGESVGDFWIHHAFGVTTVLSSHLSILCYSLSTGKVIEEKFTGEGKLIGSRLRFYDGCFVTVQQIAMLQIAAAEVRRNSIIPRGQQRDSQSLEHRISETI